VLRVAGLLLAAWVVLTALSVLLLRWVPPLTSAGMIEARMAAYRAGEHGYHTQYQWVDLKHISPEAGVAVMASEDQSFPYHRGFDVRSIQEAVRTSEHGGRLRGASTITQQVAKNLFLWSGRSLVRKGLEAYFTVLIEALWPKERILEVYLNIIELGHGVYGVEAASQHFYHIPATRLSAHEAALLAAVLPNPRRMHVERPSAYVLSRCEYILEQMRDLGGTGYLQALQSRPRSR
jgi:monofunctional biosynthetic peptidoglycan transglycosylase